MSQAAGIGVGAYAAYDSKQKLKHAQSKQEGKFKSILDNLLAMNEEGTAEQTAYQKQANKAGAAGYQGLIDDANRVEGLGTQEAQRQGAAALGSGIASMAGRGLLGSSTDANMRFGAARSTSAAVSAAQVAAAHLRGQATLGQAEQKAAGLEALGKIRGYRSNARQNIWTNYLQFIGDRNPTTDPVDAFAIGQAFGGGAGGHPGGTGGGGGGLGGAGNLASLGGSGGGGFFGMV